jgi:hypothetical protein
MNNDDFSPKARLLSYLDLFTQGKMEVQTFCDSFEHVYNMELDKAELNTTEAKAFSSLFNKVVWFSPFEDERKKIKNYIGGNEVLAEAQAATSMLQQNSEA